MSTDDRLRDYGTRSSDYGKYVRTYTDRRLYEQMLEPLRQLDLKECEVLDLGSGIGLSSVHLRDKVRSVFYLDYSGEMIDEGLRRGLIDASKATIHDFTKAPLPFDNERFDIVIARYCVHDTKDKLDLFIDIKRILRPDGLFQMVDMYAIDELSKAFYNRIHSWKTRSEIPVETHIDLLSTYKELIMRSGMTVFSITFYKSAVHTRDWVLENQITEERRRFLEELALQEIRTSASLKDFFCMKMSKEIGLCIQFPVVILTARKEPDK